MLQRLVGLVLHTVKYSDTSMIVEVYTESLGRSAFIVSVSHSKQSRAKAVLFQPLTLIEFEADIRQTKSLYRIRNATCLVPFASIPYHPYKSAMALFLAEFLYRAVREAGENKPLFAYLKHSVLWLDACEAHFSNFHLVFLMRLSRFLGLYPNLEGYEAGSYFDLLNACFLPSRPQTHSFFLIPEDASRILSLMRMSYRTMPLFVMNRDERNRCLKIVLDYYRLHLPDFPPLRSVDVLQDLFGAL